MSSTIRPTDETIVTAATIAAEMREIADDLADDLESEEGFVCLAETAQEAVYRLRDLAGQITGRARGGKS